MADEFMRFRYHVRPPDGPVNPLVQPGEVSYFPTNAIPTGWLLADGSFYSPTTYPALFSVIGYRHGKDGSGKFRVLEVTDIIQPANVHLGDLPFVVAVDDVRPHNHGAGQLASAGGHSHGVSFVDWFDESYNISYEPSPGTGTYGGGSTIKFLQDGNHSHAVTATGGGTVETAPKHTVLALCICAVGDSIAYNG